MLAQGTVTAANTEQTIVVVGSGQAIEIASIWIHSTHDQTQTVQLYLVPNNAGSLRAASLAYEFDSISLAAGKTLEWVPRLPWKYSSQNDAIYLKTTAANVLNYVVTGTVNGVIV